MTDSPVHSAARCPPGVVVCAVGDIHGRLDLLEPALEELFRIRREAWTAGKSFAAVMLGDYIDRGPDSRGVLARLAALADSEEGRGFVFLRGNHEQELLDLVDGRTHSHRWLEFGGVETLNSYYHGSGERFAMDPDADLAGLVAAAAPAEHIRFLRRTQLFVVFGDYVFVHAGLDPDAPLEAQTTDDMLWRRALTDETPRHGLTVVHGHSIHHIPVMSRWRIGIDTGAYATGALSILRLEDVACSLIKVSRSGAERRILVAPWETVGGGFEMSPAPPAEPGDPTAGSMAGLAAPATDRRPPRRWARDGARAAVFAALLALAMGAVSLLIVRRSPPVADPAVIRLETLQLLNRSRGPGPAPAAAPAARPAETVAPPPSVPPPDLRPVAEVGAFASDADARAFEAELRGALPEDLQDKPVETRAAAAGSPVLVRAFVSGFADRGAAQAFCARLAAQSRACWVTTAAEVAGAGPRDPAPAAHP